MRVVVANAEKLGESHVMPAQPATASPVKTTDKPIASGSQAEKSVGSFYEVQVLDAS